MVEVAITGEVWDNLTGTWRIIGEYRSEDEAKWGFVNEVVRARDAGERSPLDGPQRFRVVTTRTEEIEV